MDTNRKRKEVADLIDNIKEHSDRLLDHPSIPVLELNVILSKINKLYEKTAILKYLAINESKNHELSEEDRNTSNKHTSTPVDKDIIETIPQTNHLQKKNEESEENALKEDSVPSQTSGRANADNIPDPAVNTQRNIGKLEDYLDVNAKFSTEEDPSLSHQLKKQPISNLMTAIGLNERYLFANHLFDGHMEKFLEAVKALNTFESSDKAMQFFDNTLAEEFNWDKSDELVAAFRLLVERRFH